MPSVDTAYGMLIRYHTLPLSLGLTSLFAQSSDVHHFGLLGKQGEKGNSLKACQSNSHARCGCTQGKGSA